MSTDLDAHKAAIDLRTLVSETHSINRNGKVRCPSPTHPDHHPSCHIWPDRFKCFACKLSGDHIDWLELVYDINTAEAIQELKHRVASPSLCSTPPPKVTPSSLATFKQVPAGTLSAHRHKASQLDGVPQAMQGRGFVLADLQLFGFAAAGEDAIFPVSGPDGTVFALKRRFATPRDNQRYRYVTPGHGTPAWCSPGFREQDAVLIVEGELNAMASFLAAPHLGVMGVAGTGGALYTEALKDRKVYVYADGDEPGQKARSKWSAQALEAGAVEVYVLDPWLADACEIAGREGLAALRERLT